MITNDEKKEKLKEIEHFVYRFMLNFSSLFVLAFTVFCHLWICIIFHVTKFVIISAFFPDECAPLFGILKYSLAKGFTS
jgi:hypothetical protein